MHHILSKIATPADLDFAINESFIEGKITREKGRLIKNEMQNILSDPKIIDWFSSDWKIIKERPIFTKKGKIKIPDRVLIKDNELIVIDFKFGEKKAKIPKIFATTYPNSEFQIVNPDNFFDFLGI